MSRRAHRRAGRTGLGVATTLLVLALGPGMIPEARAHPLAPALLELREASDGRVDVLWKRSSLAVPGSDVRPVVPEDCSPLSEPAVEQQGVAVRVRWAIDCGETGLVGRTVRVEGLGPAKIDALLRVELADGRTVQRVLRASESEVVVPARPSRWNVFTDYLRVGFGHILSGVDHLLFVFGLFLLCGGVPALVKTVTSFTVGHSVTLSLAALGYARLPSGPIELLIAASVLVLAVELARDGDAPTWMRRYPWPMALLFGLLHGLGFAGALREVGLPEGEIPMALFSFNVGIEIGQLVFVAALLLAAPLVRRLPIEAPLRVAVYAMGSLAAFWLLERGAALL